MSFPKEKSKRKGSDEDKPVLVKNAADLQRLKIEKLMKNPDKQVVIPDRPKRKNEPHVPEFVRNVMGSSAGAGSGEFHVYRHLRRKEYARQKFIQEKAEKETEEDEYHRRIEENKQKAEELTAKKRAKRQKRKKNKKFKKTNTSNAKSESESEEESEGEEVQPEDTKPNSSNENQSDSPNSSCKNKKAIKTTNFNETDPSKKEAQQDEDVS